MRHAHLFSNVPSRDYLGFWADRTLQAKAVADFVALDRHEVARVAGVSSASVRWDQKIPREVLDRLTEIAVVCSLVAQFFEGDAVKTKLWFQMRNPLLGDLSPRDMIRHGRCDRLRRFVMDALAVPNKIASNQISGTARIGTREDQATDVLSTGARPPGDFWQAMSFDELAAAQGVGPMTEIDALVGTWPGEANDGFEESIRRLREANIKAA